MQTIAKLAGILSLLCCGLALDELERRSEYYRRGHEWPPRDFHPGTEGWKKLMERRFKQLKRIDNSNDKYNAFLSTVHSAINCKNFTENGWGLTKAPKPIIEALRKSLNEGLENEPKYETKTLAIETENLPFFIDQYDLNFRIMHEMLPLHEAWAGVELVPNNAYGLRVYRNNSHLNMHVDKTETHVISSILHVDHDEEGEPWPIVIEDFQGNTNEVILESGDMLFYESSKCLHGRPAKFNGSWYSSLFTHYYPKSWNEDHIDLENHYRIPPDWNDNVWNEESDIEELVSAGTSVKEPECDNQWCALKNSVIWTGSPEYGKVLSVDGVITNLNFPPHEELLELAKNRLKENSEF